MPVSTTLTVHRYKPGAAMAAEAIPFPYLAPDDLSVTHVAALTGVRTVLVAGYALAGDGAAKAGTIRALAAWPADDVFEVARRTALIQTADVKPHEPLPADELTRQLDRMTMAAQERMAETHDLGRRGLFLPVGEEVTTLPARAARRGKVLAFDAYGDPVGASLGVADGGLRDDLASDDGGARLVSYQGRSVEAKLGETVSITDARFAGGAMPAPADSTGAFQAAIDAVFTAGGGTVMVPAGRWNIGTIRQRAGVRIAGVGYASRVHSTNTTRANGIIAEGPEGGPRLRGLSIENLRLTSGFDAVRDGAGKVIGNNGVLTGNAIRWLRVSQSFIQNVWTHNWQDSGVSLTDCDHVHGDTIDIAVVSQGYDIFNDCWKCTADALTIRDAIVYVGLNIEGLAAGATTRPRDCGASNVLVDGATTHGINFVNAIRPYITGWNVTNTRGSHEGPGDGLQAYGCIGANLGVGTAFGNAGHGLDIGPTMDDAKADGILTMGNGLGGCRVTDGGGIGTALRVSLGFSRFMEGPPQLVGNASITNVVHGLTLEAALPMLNLLAQSAVNRNAQIVFRSGMDADRGRIGWDLSTNNGSNIFQVYLDSYGGQILGVQTDSITGGNDNSQSLGRANRRFSTVFAGTGTINTSDATTKQQIGAIPEPWLDAWGDVEWVRFKFNDAVTAKGEAARWHTGLIAQRIRDVFALRGLDATETGLLCYDEWPAETATAAQCDADGAVIVPATPAAPAGSLWSVRAAECQAMEAAWQRRELARLHARLDAIGAAHG